MMMVKDAIRTAIVLLAFAAAVIGGFTTPGWAQVPAGAEFQINTYTTSSQEWSVAASRGNGDFVVVWRSRQDGSDYGVFGQLYDAAGVRVGSEFQANTFTTQSQYSASVAGDTRGNVVVVWQSFQDGDQQGIFGRRFDAAGRPRGGEFQVNTYTTSSQIGPVIAASANGTFVVVWRGYGQDGSYSGVFGQRLSGSGVLLGSEFRVNTYTPRKQHFPSVALDSRGAFVVAWESETQDGSDYGVFARRYDSSGNPQGPEFQVNSYTTDRQGLPSVASAADGSFVVTWTSNWQDPVAGIFAQRFDAAGARLGTEFRVNSYTSDNQALQQVAADANGNFTVVWQSYAQDGSNWSVFGQRYDRLGNARGTEFRLNTYTTGPQEVARIASDASGNLLATWTSIHDGFGPGIFGQRFGGLVPAALTVDTAGNFVLEPGEAVDVRPAWRNVNGASQTFSATLINMAGPAGATYSITDPTGNYGTVANGATAPCSDCYAVSVSNPPTRPAVHWDASAVESIAPDAQGQQKLWLLHVGRSFTDVPSSNTFYRFVETLLHHSVTGGCSGTQYCPASSTTREQMAVFVLVAKEGTGYVPPACSTPIFADVPASSPFCRWIEELVRRAVVSGCGGGNYCPSSAVTREQMAVFVLSTLDPVLNPPACGTPMFADVPPSSPFCKWIEELARRGVVSGCGGGNYCPLQPVTREQMGVFISVTFGLMLYGP
jgi:hypothetical protein